MSAFIFSQTLFAATIGATVGVHDFIVNDIEDDGALGHISPGTSHTLGLNASAWVTHSTPGGINIFAKAEIFRDFDQDELDPDHIPVWFDFVADIDGSIHAIDDDNTIKWYLYMDNRQNTVSCIEREIKQHVGIGWQFKKRSFMFALNAYAGFYYIELDDDTPLSRGYTRFELDDGEASNVLELESSYTFSNGLSLYAGIKRFSANAGMQTLETDFNFLASYKAFAFMNQDATLNFKVKHIKYDFSRFSEGHTYSVLPWDNDTLVQAYVSLPLY